MKKNQCKKINSKGYWKNIEMGKTGLKNEENEGKMLSVFVKSAINRETWKSPWKSFNFFFPFFLVWMKRVFEFFYFFFIFLFWSKMRNVRDFRDALKVKIYSLPLDTCNPRENNGTFGRKYAQVVMMLHFSKFA